MSNWACKTKVCKNRTLDTLQLAQRSKLWFVLFCLLAATQFHHQVHGVINALSPGRLEGNFHEVIFYFLWTMVELSLVNWALDECHWLTDMSTLVQIVALCHQAPSHYLNQCWPWSLYPYDSTRPQWVKYSFSLKYFIGNWLCTVTNGWFMWPPEIERIVEEPYLQISMQLESYCQQALYQW